jgi:glutamate-1-semialdehyde 2,1-aminomutase
MKKISLQKKTKKGQALYKIAKKIIPGGNSFFSKRPELYLPNSWPPYFKKTKGCQIWDIDNNRYTDMGLMGVGTNTLGYNNPAVDQAVLKVVRSGNLSSLNSTEEVMLAKELIKIHPWAKNVKFARTGGEANAIAIRIARSYSKKVNIAICGYHGWHDWYLAENLKQTKKLGNHVKIKGVPKNLKNTIYSFEYNNFKQLEYLVKNKKIGIICMEVTRNEEPKNNFLKKIRRLANKNKIVLIFDECTSAFRKNYGGIHQLYKVTPDLALFGKALGNGYAITAIIGKKKIMRHSQESFISSTFWTERIGLAAGLATLKEMKKIKSWRIIDKNGKYIVKKLTELANKNKIEIKIQGIPSICNYIIISKNWQKYKTFITQEMLKKGFLATNAIYTCISHTKKIIDKYFFELEPIFRIIKKCENGEKISKYLKHPVCHRHFKRLN